MEEEWEELNQSKTYPQRKRIRHPRKKERGILEKVLETFFYRIPDDEMKNAANLIIEPHTESEMRSKRRDLRIRDARAAYNAAAEEIGKENMSEYAAGRGNGTTSFGSAKTFRDAQRDLMLNGKRRIGIHRSLDDAVYDYYTHQIDHSINPFSSTPVENLLEKKSHSRSNGGHIDITKLKFL